MLNTINRYSESLFFGHIVLEKILKSLVVKKTENEAPKTHDLVRLAELTELKLSDRELEQFKIVNRFNMRTRYPDTKLEFHKSCNLEYTESNIEKIKKLYKKLLVLSKIEKKRLSHGSLLIHMDLIKEVRLPNLELGSRTSKRGLFCGIIWQL